MTGQKTTTAAAKKSGGVMGALMDLVILALMLAAAGFGGYFWGIHQQLAPVKKVAEGTPGALPAATAPAATTAPVATVTPPPAPTTPATTPPAAQTAPTPATTTTTPPTKGKTKYWLSSSGVDYIGSSVTVTVNGKPVDSFFGPGKNVDITRHIKKGENTILFEAKALGKKYNQHAGDASSKLTVQLVRGPSITEDFKQSDVLLGITRDATMEESNDETNNFVVD